MTFKNFGNLLFDAVRETLETMAFAEVVPYSIQIGNEEFSSLDDSDKSGKAQSGWGYNETENPNVTPPIQTDFTEEEESGKSGTYMIPAVVAPPSSTQAAASADDAEADSWGVAGSEGDAWGTSLATDPSIEDDDDNWGTSIMPAESAETEADPWAGVATPAQQPTSFAMKASDINFNALLENEGDWIWACMRVNSPDIHSIWFIVSKSLAFELARNMYAGEQTDLNSPLIRDIVAELTNVFGGRLMLLLEKVGGQFTLSVPDIGIGLPKIPEASTMETILCKVLVDGEYPVMASICFNKK
ncbi:MAG: hypothetical protein ACRC2T_12555 [Thermoguttaceae bacterium]